MRFVYSERVEKEMREKGIETGDRIRARWKGRELEGVLMPRPELGDENALIVKLDNGYNIGIVPESIELVSKRKIVNASKLEIEMKEGDEISLIYTGGTIGSKIDYSTGGVHMLTKPEELLAEVPEIKDIARLKIRHLFSMDSADMGVNEWVSIAKAAYEELGSSSEGVVITHGTDTMHFTASAVSFAVQSLPKPIVITGAQRSSDRGSSDAFMNLLCSARAALSDFAEVGICMHGESSDTYCTLIRGVKARKMHTSHRAAFKAVNDSPIARVWPNGSIEWIGNRRRRSDGKAVLLGKFSEKVALLKAYPESSPEVIDFFIGKGYEGIVIEGTGLGNVPVHTSKKSMSWVEHIERAIRDGAIVCIAAETLNGRVDYKVYSNLRIIKKTGAIFCEDMLPETAYVKLSFLLGNYEKEEAKKLMGKNIVGEISERTEAGWYA
ncbi:MAG: Glu-tRNA(Gln) amidotransferase subunit GatD [Candidatus Micrarchaeaceae archaeon]